MMGMELKQWMEQIVEDNGLDALKPDENGSYLFLCDDLEMFIQPQEDAVIFEARLAPLPEELNGKVARIAMEANHLYDETAGASFVFDAGTKRLVLREEIFPQDSSEFGQALNAFILNSERWQALLARYVELQQNPDESVTGSADAESIPPLGIPNSWLSI